MKSIRARLTFSYAVVVSLVLIVVAILGTRLLFEVLARPTLEALSAATVGAREYVRQHRPLTRSDVEVLAAWEAVHPGVFVLVSGDRQGAMRDPAPMIGGPSDPERMPPPSDDGPPEIAPAVAAPAAMPKAPEPGSWPERMVRFGGLDAFLGLAPRRIAAGPGSITLLPDLSLVAPALRSCLWILVAASVAAIVIAWLTARFLAAQALAPMVAVTEQLERFSSGDFATRTIVTSDAAELGRLTEAYNGAAAQVASAMSERAAVEAQLRRFLADGGHALRTPLTVIGGYVAILRKGGFDDPSIRETALSTLTLEVRRSQALVERLLTLARLERTETAEPVLVDVVSVARTAIELVVRARPGDVTLAGVSEAPAMADPAELQDALDNLIDNAVKYGRGSPVTVAVSSEAEAVVVRVRDGGPGIPEDERERIFERFFRGADANGIDGSGLGLAIGERAAARCGGSVALESGAPGATTFRLTLPSPRASVRANGHIRL